jgi:hypothetical protein
LLLLDGCSAYDGDFFFDLCLQHNIIPCYIPPHSSNQVQPLDLCVFGVTKRLMTRLNKMDKENIQSVHAGKFVSAFHSTCNRVNVIASFRKAGIVLHLESTGVAVCYVEKYQCRCLLRHFEAPIAVIEV